MNNVSAGTNHDNGIFFEQALQQCSWQHFVTATSGHYRSSLPRRHWVAQPDRSFWYQIQYRSFVSGLSQNHLGVLIKGRHNMLLKAFGHRQLLLKSLSIFCFSFTCSSLVFSSLLESYLTSTPWRLQMTASCPASSPCVIGTKCWAIQPLSSDPILEHLMRRAKPFQDQQRQANSANTAVILRKDSSNVMDMASPLSLPGTSDVTKRP